MGWNLMKFGWYLGEIDDLYTCVVIHGGLYMGVYIIVVDDFDDIWMIFGWYLDDN